MALLPLRAKEEAKDGAHSLVGDGGWAMAERKRADRLSALS